VRCGGMTVDLDRMCSETLPNGASPPPTPGGGRSAGALCNKTTSLEIEHVKITWKMHLQHMKRDNQAGMGDGGEQE
jgi:hypothetical protein